MATTFDNVTQTSLPLSQPQISTALQRTFVNQRLTAVFESAEEVPFDDTSRIVFFSDCHRGDNSRADDFAKNASLFLNVLTRYYQDGFSYVEVGDGDELWKNRRFRVIREAHGRVFDLLHKFDAQDRLRLILGNHDIQGCQRHQVKKDGMVANEGLVLKHVRTGQRLFVVHGHQADFKSDRLYQFSRLIVRSVWRRLQLLNLAGTTKSVDLDQPYKSFEHKLVDWAGVHRQLTICGHTHRPASATYGTSPYFNTGCCVVPGVLTGLEIQGGEIVLVRWHARSGGDGVLEREVLATPRKLKFFA